MMKTPKNYPNSTIKQNFGSGLLIVILIIFSLANADLYAIKTFETYGVASEINALFYPDSTETDTTETEIAFGDTIETIMDGMDTIYLLSDVMEDSNLLEERLINTSDVLITLKDEMYSVNDGGYGVNLEGYFMHYNHEDEATDYSTIGAVNPNQLLKEFSPKVLRHPSGASSKFQHPFGSMNSNDPALPTYKKGFKNGGYGYSIEEIIRYYDKTDNFLDLFDDLTLADIIDDMANEVVDLTWMDAADEADFESFYKKWLEQPAFDPDDFTVDEIEEIWDEPLYINDFISLVKDIETTQGYTIDVISAINILSEPAVKVAEMIDYMRDGDLNHQDYSVNIVGIELGNECYFSFYERAMGFACYEYNSAFDHYWAYINGEKYYDDYFDVEGDFDLEDVLDASMLGMGPDGFNKHDYIGVLRSDSKYNDIKIGIPVSTPEAEGAFNYNPEGDMDELEEESSAPCSLSWNEGVVSKYSATTFGEKEYGQYIFDAVVPHLYLTSQNGKTAAENINWGEIPVGGYTPIGGTYIPNCLDNNLATADHDNFTSEYTYTSSDTRLNCAFAGIIDPLRKGSFNQFIRQKQKLSMMDLAAELKLDGTAEHPKECWITEWNIKNNSPEGEVDTEERAKFERRDVYNNKFVHAVITQEEFMNNIKMNFQSEFQYNFITITTINSFIGGSPTNLVINSSEKDLASLELIDDCSNSFKPFLPRTLYFSFN